MNTRLALITMLLRPKTGFSYGKFDCSIFSDKFVLVKRREGLFDKKVEFEIPFRAIEKIEDKNYMTVKGIRIYLNDPNIEYPASPSLLLDGLVGCLISFAKRNKFILYFNKNKEKDIFLNISKKAGVPYIGNEFVYMKEYKQ